ncbi:leukotriene B4 receptor 1-like protein [Lates japonicus]|uniref:Leukotriene B4 receptor 1-like protein n=1 Tax=Lates japonicus TaxID=270547 RepID=A0AAD3MNG7_LATJO|nr:leukotriene B4 receptor 1-like protein [Lates japonicus]
MYVSIYLDLPDEHGPLAGCHGLSVPENEDQAPSWFSCLWSGPSWLPGALSPHQHVCYASAICRQSARFHRRGQGSRLISMTLVPSQVFWLPYHIANIVEVIGLLQGSDSVMKAAQTAQQTRPLPTSSATIPSHAVCCAPHPPGRPQFTGKSAWRPPHQRAGASPTTAAPQQLVSSALQTLSVKLEAFQKQEQGRRAAEGRVKILRLWPVLTS